MTLYGNYYLQTKLFFRNDREVPRVLKTRARSMTHDSLSRDFWQRAFFFIVFLSIIIFIEDMNKRLADIEFLDVDNCQEIQIYS